MAITVALVGLSVGWAALVAKPPSVSGRVVLLVAFGLRLPFVFAPYASDDLHRYVWEGRIQAEGFSPYAHAPNAPELEHLRDDRFDRIGHPEYTTIYPPLAEALFLVATSAGLREAGLRAVIVGIDLAVVAAVLAWLRRARLQPGRAIAYAWCPLVVVAAGTGHVDPLMLLALAGTGWAIAAERPRTAAALLGAAILAKTVAVLLLPWFVWRHRRAAPIAAAVVLLGYAPYLPAGGVFDTLVDFGKEFAFNGSLFRLAELGAPGIARPLVGTLLVGWVATTTVRARSFAGVTAATFAGLLALSPTVHLWYLTWFLVALPVVGARPASAPLVAWAASAWFALQTYWIAATGGAFEERFAFTTAEYVVPLAVGLAAAGWAGYRRRTARPESGP